MNVAIPFIQNVETDAMATAAEQTRPADAADDFRQEVRGWIEANFPASLRGSDNAMSAVEGPTEETPDQRRWREAMGDKGWGVPTWPKEYGGGGLDRAQARIVQEELARAGAYNPIGGMGVMMFGPTLLEYGSEEQKQQHIPGIVRGEVRWCQGYSEPGAGSDLASLQTFAEDKGDHYLVNGQKTWTSGGQWADKCFALVRTDKTQKHAGISFLLIDMDAEGVETRPIKLISGASPFCETFFTNVKVPKENLVGREGQGWEIGTRLLQHERNSLSGGGGSQGRMNQGEPIVSIARKYRDVDADGKLADSDLRTRIIKHEMDQRAFALTLRRAKSMPGRRMGGMPRMPSLRAKKSRLLTRKKKLTFQAMVAMAR